MANLFYKWKYIPFDSFSLTHLHPLTLVTVSQRKNAYMRSLWPNKKVIYFFLLICKRSWLEKAMATHSSTPAWKIPWREEVPGRLQSMGSLSGTQLSGFTFTFHFHALEKEMAAHSSVLAWRIPGTGEPGRLPSMGSRRVGHDWNNLAAAAACFNVNSYFLNIHP